MLFFRDGFPPPLPEAEDAVEAVSEGDFGLIRNRSTFRWSQISKHTWKNREK